MTNLKERPYLSIKPYLKNIFFTMGLFLALPSQPLLGQNLPDSAQTGSPNSDFSKIDLIPPKADTTVGDTNALHLDITPEKIDVASPDTAKPEKQLPIAKKEPSGKSSMDIELDMSVGLSITDCKITPSNIQTSRDYNVVFDFGFSIPFHDYFFFNTGFRRYAFTFNTKDSIADFTTFKGYTVTSTKEWLSYLSLPLTLGCNFGNGSLVPGLFATLQPSYLVSAARSTVRDVYRVFPDSTILTNKQYTEKDLTSNRTRFLFLAGAGAGLEFFYGYGTVYVSASFIYALKDIGNIESDPIRTKTTLWSVPVMAGIRFFL